MKQLILMELPEFIKFFPNTTSRQTNLNYILKDVCSIYNLNSLIGDVYENERNGIGVILNPENSCICDPTYSNSNVLELNFYKIMKFINDHDGSIKLYILYQKINPETQLPHICVTIFSSIGDVYYNGKKFFVSFDLLITFDSFNYASFSAVVDDEMNGGSKYLFLFEKIVN